MNKPNFGFDAPGVIRWLFIFSLLSLAASFASRLIPYPLFSKIVLLYFFSSALFTFASGVWMLYGTKRGKPKLLRKIAEEFALSGSEKILDVGCGRGLFLIEMAQKLKTGRAHGIDLWIGKDQSGNALENTRRNAESAGVSDKIELTTADMRQIPYPDNTFDIAVSSLAIHNLKNKEERDLALKEILRVLKPGGSFALLDIQHAPQYTQTLKQLGARNVKISAPHYLYCPPVSIVKGNKG